MKCQETVLLVSSLLSILGSTIIIISLLSLSFPDLLTGVLAENLYYLEALLQEEIVQYDISLDVRQLRAPVIIILYTLAGFTILESVLLILGVKTKVSCHYSQHLVHSNRADTEKSPAAALGPPFLPGGHRQSRHGGPGLCWTVQHG